MTQEAFRTMTVFDETPAAADEDLQRLKSALELVGGGTGRVTVAYSGGLDSRFLCFCASRMGFAVRLLHVAGPHIAREETEQAQRLAQAMGLEAEVVHIELAGARELAQAGRERCYVCKKKIFSQLKEMAEGGRLCDGTNTSDLTAFRPGGRAVAELGIFSPLAMAGLAKPDIYRLAALLGLPEPRQAARPCLLTRFAYGVEPDAAQLETVGEVEDWLSRQDFAQGLRFRLRYPDGSHPVLHLEGASIKAERKTVVQKAKEALLARFGDRLKGLKVEVLDVLSGYYDRIKSR